MTPSELNSIGSSLVNSFKYEMLNQYAIFSNKIAKELRESVDARHIEYQKQRLAMASAFIDIMLDYFYITDDSDTNFFNTEEFYDIVKHLNRLFGTVYWIQLN